jgi:methionyl-tRNA formyltransferase
MSSESAPVIVLATPHRRYDVLEARVRERLKDCRVIRVRERNELTSDALQRLAPSFVFFPQWSWLIPADIHTRFDCVIFHMTDLPYGRGGSPLQNLIVRGHKDTQLSALKCVAKLDAGPIYLKRPLSLAGTAEEIFARAAQLMEEMIADIVLHRPEPSPQAGAVVEFQRRRPEDGNLSALQDLEQVYDFIRMLDGEGYPPAFLECGQLRLEFAAASLQRAGDETLVEAKVTIRSVPK